MEKIDFTQRVFIAAGLGAVFMLAAMLLEVLFGVKIINQLLDNSLLFNIFLPITLLLIAPMMVRIVNVNMAEQLRPHTFIILGVGLLTIFLLFIVLWFLSK